MATKSVKRGPSAAVTVGPQISTNAESLMMAAIERGGDLATTGRFLMTFKEGATGAGIKHLESKSGFRLASAADFENQAAVLEAAGDADGLVFPEIGVALMGGQAAAAHNMTAYAEIAEDSPVQAIDPEYFMFAAGINAADYMKGVLHTAEMIARDLGVKAGAEVAEVISSVPSATWGLIACNVPPSTRDGNGIKVAVLDTGFDLAHPDFAGRSFVTETFCRATGAGSAWPWHSHHWHRLRSQHAAGSDSTLRHRIQDPDFFGQGAKQLGVRNASAGPGGD